MHDLTDIKRAELARVDFLANASHELRTPLTSLAGFIETMRGPARDDPAAWDRFLEIMQGQADRMRRLISDLLSLSRIELNEHRPPETLTDLAAVVREVVDALQPVARSRGVILAVRASDRDVIVAGIRDELSQVAQNLIDNAIKYSEPDGVVEIEIRDGLDHEAAFLSAGRRWEAAGRMSIATAPVRRGGEEERFAFLRVSDSGPGIDRQYLPRLAERFYRVDPGRGLRRGTGLGLAIVKHVVTRHRGDFVVESELGRGAAFGVVLSSGPLEPISPTRLPGPDAI
jgi:two-component system phosphate regulon sensor histidine kinase PhoR